MTGLRERYELQREKVRELLADAYERPGAEPLREAGPALLDLLDVAREALDELAAAEAARASWERTSREYERLAAEAGLL